MGFPFIIVDSENPYTIDSYKYFAYRLKFNEIESFTSKYQLNKWIEERIENYNWIKKCTK